jgi:hypothetical protein
MVFAQCGSYAVLTLVVALFSALNRTRISLLEVFEDLHCNRVEMPPVRICVCDKRSFYLTFSRSRLTWRLKWVTRTKVSALHLQGSSSGSTVIRCPRLLPSSTTYQSTLTIPLISQTHQHHTLHQRCTFKSLQSYVQISHQTHAHHWTVTLSQNLHSNQPHRNIVTNMLKIAAATVAQPHSLQSTIGDALTRTASKSTGRATSRTASSATEHAGRAERCPARKFMLFKSSCRPVKR